MRLITARQKKEEKEEKKCRYNIIIIKKLALLTIHH